MANNNGKTANTSSMIVAIGASAAGLSALESFFRNVPPETGLTYVVIQHLLPDHKSILSEILSKYTQMDVIQISNDMEIETNTVYVIPPGKDIEVTDKHFKLKEQKHNLVRMPIDHFLRSLKYNRKDKSIAVILSGTGSDGTLGIKEIKEEFGMVMAQSPDTAGYRSMPQSAIDTGLVDYILPPEQMPAQIINYIERFKDAEKENGIFNIADLDYVLNSIFKRLKHISKHDFSEYKRNTVFRRIERRLAVNSLNSLHDYLNLLRSSETEARSLFKELLIGVTSFFRDPETFSYLENEILPALAPKMSGSGILRIWVTACASGEEAYSIAMLVHRFIESNKINTQVQIFSTDIDDHALETGRFGKYLENMITDIPEDLLKKYFVNTQGYYQVTKNIRDMIIFANQSLLKDPPYSHIDLISCRNFMIYLNRNVQQRVMNVFHYALNPSGYLILGNSESFNSKSNLFRQVDLKHKIYSKIDNSTAIRDFWNYPEINYSPTVKTNTAKEKRHISVKEFAEKTALEKFMNPMLVINKEGDILYSLGSCKDYFQFTVGEPTNNIINSAGEGLKIPLANGLRKMNQERKLLRYDNIKVLRTKKDELVNIIFDPVEKPVSLNNLIVVTIQPTSIHIKKHSEKKISDYSEDYIKEMDRELSETRDYLKNVIEQLQSTNEELKSSNEETQSANEELQSANEELETSKEELQSLNEELSTSNYELQRKIEEVSKVNNDINNLLTSTQIGTLFLNKALIIKRFTPPIKDIFHVIESDVGRPIGNFVTKFDTNVDLIEIVRNVTESLIPKEMEIQVRERFFWMRILPYRTFEDSIDGVVITFTDISELKNMKKEIERATERYLALFESMINGVIFFEIRSNKNAVAILANKAFEKQTGLSPSEIKEKSISEIFPHWDSGLIKKLIESATREKPFETEVYFEKLDQYFTIYSFAPRPMQLAIVLQDITSFKNEIKTKLLLSSIVESTEDAIFTVDKNEKISTWNKGAEKTYGYTAREIIGKPLNILLEDHTDDHLFDERGDKSSYQFNTVHRHKSGTKLPVWVTRSPIQDQDKLISDSYVVKDISPLIRREEEIIKAKEAAEQLTRVKTSFLENFSHEIRTPLNSVMGFTEMLKKTDLNNDQKSLLDAVSSSGKQMIDLTDDINDFNAMQGEKFVINKNIINLAELIKDAANQGLGLLHSLSKGKDIKLRTLISDEHKGIVILSDYKRIQQVILNLLQNAFKFTRHGEIVIGLNTPENNSVKIFVRDTGIGIDFKDQQRIFEPFEQVIQINEVHRGTGLGLTIARELVDLLGGSISLESEPGKGSAFFIHLPYDDRIQISDREVKKQKDKDIPLNLKGKNILIVEDDLMSMQLLEIVISESYAGVIKAFNGPEAIKLFKENKVDLVILDKRLPGMDGFEVFKKLREMNPAIPIIGQSAHVMNSDKELSLKMGFNEFITKPFDFKKMREIFRKYLEE